ERRGRRPRRVAGIGWKRKKKRWGRAVLVALDEDALAGALLGGLHDGVLEVTGNRGHAGGATRVVLDGVGFLDVGEAVIEKGEDRRRDLLTQAVARTEILVDPDLHVPDFSLWTLSSPPDGPSGP